MSEVTIEEKLSMLNVRIDSLQIASDRNLEEIIKLKGRAKEQTHSPSFCEITACHVNNGEGSCMAGLCPESCCSRVKNFKHFTM